MGCGKSYVGRNLAPLLGLSMLILTNTQKKKKVCYQKEIFEQKGEDYFRLQEKDFIQQVDDKENLVIEIQVVAFACFFDNMDVMNEKGLTIYLNRNKEKTIWRLLKGQYKRPLIANLSPEENYRHFMMNV